MRFAAIALVLMMGPGEALGRSQTDWYSRGHYPVPYYQGDDRQGEKAAPPQTAAFREMAKYNLEKLLGAPIEKRPGD